MQKENKILFENIKNFRQLITEAVGDNAITDAIENHEYIYIYYAGDETIERGSRTIRPYVLGKTKAGNTVLRAWQDKGKSDSLRPDSLRKRYEHEYWTDLDGKEKPGWRLFRVDKISHMYPIGKKFNDENGNVIIPPKYREGADEQMGGGIIAYVSTKTTGIEPPAAQKQPSAFDAQANKFKRFYNANAKNRNITAADVQKLVDITKRVMKKSINNFLVVINNKNEFEAQPITYKDKFPPEAIVGNLSSLYSKLVLQNAPLKPEVDNFIKGEQDKLKKGAVNKNVPVDNPNVTAAQNNSQNNSNNLAEKKTFFKQ